MSSLPLSDSTDVVGAAPCDSPDAVSKLQAKLWKITGKAFKRSKSLPNRSVPDLFEGDDSPHRSHPPSKRSRLGSSDHDGGRSDVKQGRQLTGQRSSPAGIPDVLICPECSYIRIRDDIAQVSLDAKWPSCSECASKPVMVPWNW